jgi:iron complex outermembrane recepter protein
MRSQNSGHRAGAARGVVVCAAAFVVVAWLPVRVMAQSAPTSTTLPPVTVEASKPTAAQKPKQAKTKKAVPSVQAASPKPTTPASQSSDKGTETGTSPVKGFVAGVSATATKTDTPLLATPQAVSVVTRDQMEQQGAQSVKQALQYTSGVAADTRTAFGGYDIVYSRGFILDRYLDGLKVLGGAAYTTPQIEIYGLERLEVLHGPASMLYGASSPGGIVNAISKRPTDEPFHELQFQFGNFDHVEAAFDFSGPITADKRWLYRLSGLASTTDSQVDFNEQERYWIAPSLTYRDADTTITFLANLQHDPEVGLYSNIPSTGSLISSPLGHIPRDRYLGEPGFNTNTRDQHSIGYALEHRVDETWTVRQNVRYQHTDGVVQQFLPLGASGSTLSRYVLDQKADIDSFAVDTNAEAKFRTGFIKHKLMFGTDYQKLDELADYTRAFAVGAIDIFNPVYGNLTSTPFDRTYTDQALDQTGLYVQDQMELDRLILTLGVRKDFLDITTDDLVNHSSSHQDDEAVTERLGATYLLGEGLAPYASYSTSFQPATGVTSSGAPFAPTTGQQYEVGIKYQPVGYDALFTVAAYDLTQQNVPTTDPAKPSGRIQVGEIRTRGIEFEGKASLDKHLDVIGSYTRSDTEITKANDGTQGNRPLNIPDEVASLWAFYTSRNGPLNAFGFGAGVRYVGNTAGNAANTLFVPQYTLYDAAAKYDLGKLSLALAGTDLQLNVTNLFDKEYVSQCSNNVTCLYGNGRTVLTTLRYHW